MKTTTYPTIEAALNAGVSGHLIFNPTQVYDWLPEEIDASGFRRVEGDGYAYWVLPKSYTLQDLSGDPGWTKYRDAGRLLGYVADGQLKPITAA